MEKFQGRLHYFGWGRRPWKLFTTEGEIDLWPLVESVFVSLNGKRATQHETRESYTLSSDPTAKRTFEYQPDLAILSRERSFLNITAHLEETLLRVNGRFVEIEIGEGSFKISADRDRTEEVFPLNSSLAPRGMRLEIPNGAERTICKIGQGTETCVFLTHSSMGEFYCEKFHPPTALKRLDQLLKKETVAGRIGNCAF